MASIEDQIRQHIAAEFLNGEGASELSDETRLIDEEVIDSLGIYLLVPFLEERFGIDVDPDEVSSENFESVSAMALLVSRLKSAASPEVMN